MSTSRGQWNGVYIHSYKRKNTECKKQNKTKNMGSKYDNTLGTIQGKRHAILIQKCEFIIRISTLQEMLMCFPWVEIKDDRE